jgi:short-subunit dehydrogenase
MPGPSFCEEFMPNTAVRKAIVTGASKGIGAVYARKLAKRGYDLVTVARNAARLEANASRIREETGRQVEVIVADLSKSAEVLKLAQRIAGDATVALLVNNAGVSSQGGVLQNTLADAERLIAVNITAPTLLSIAAAKAFAERGGGAVVNISSVTAFVPRCSTAPIAGRRTT